MEFVHSDRLFYVCIFMEKELLGLALAMAWGVLPVCLRGQDREMDLQEVEVSAPSGKMYSELGRVLTVLDREEIERLPVRTVDELLDQVAGLDVRQRGTGGVQASGIVLGADLLFRPVLFGAVLLACLVFNALSTLLPAWMAVRRNIAFTLVGGE